MSEEMNKENMELIDENLDNVTGGVCSTLYFKCLCGNEIRVDQYPDSSHREGECSRCGRDYEVWFYDQKMFYNGDWVYNGLGMRWKYWSGFAPDF